MQDISDKERVIKLVSQEFSDAWEGLNKRREMYKDETKHGHIIRNAGIVVIAVALIYFAVFIPPSAEMATKAPPSVVLIIGLVLLIVGIKFIERALTPQLSIDEEAFLNVYDSLKYIDDFLKGSSGWSRIKATKKLAKVEKKISDVQTADSNGNPLLLWEALIKEENINMRLLKQNLKERLLPSIIQSDKEGLKKTYSIIEDFGKFLLNPTILELQGLNKKMSVLNPLSKKEPFINAFLKHPYTHQIIASIIIVLSGVFVYYLGINILGIQKDNAFLAGTALVGTFAYIYFTIIAKKT